MAQQPLIGTHYIANREEFCTLARRFAQSVKAGDVLLLSGELGAGKTTFAQCLGAALGVQDVIMSPTYTLVGEYGTSGNRDILQFIHIDLYRTTDQGAYIQEIIESATDQKAIVVVEWGELFEKEIQNRTWKIHLKPGDTEDERVVTVDY